MNNFDTLICFFFFSLGGRNTGLINAEILVHTGEEGGNITVGCFFTFSGKTKFFCKEPCEQGDILIKTEEDTAESGRYSIKYKEVGSKVIYVTITKLIKSDAGKYRCGLDRSFLPSSSSEIEITVEEVTVQPSPASVPSASTETTTQSVSSSTGSCTPPSAPPEGTKTTQKTQTTKGGLLYVGLSLAVIIVVLLAAALILCRKRASKPKDHPVDTIYPNHTEDNRVYEEIREEDRRSSSAPVDISSLYTSVKYNTQNEVETTDVYSLATAATSHETGDSASCGERDNVIYSSSS
ncbi:CMRF35-like molecule 8 isoform X2 [Pungitius pungitius]|uniref:CMRF35-like molecule 8 isoform X2 n=1 Tax=Pungitius pungitius TaxID=134920 RepID=UPI002E158115